MTKENQPQFNNLNVEGVTSTSGLSDKINVITNDIIHTPESHSPDVSDDQKMNKETPQRADDVKCRVLNKRQLSQDVEHEGFRDGKGLNEED